jgi:biopolymer transport protein ExbB
VLVRLHEGVFSFMSAKEDGSDLRFTADDHKTVLKHHVEKWDSLLNEAYVWVQVPDLKPAAATAIWLYYGNATEAWPPIRARKPTMKHRARVSLCGCGQSRQRLLCHRSERRRHAATRCGSLIGGGLRVFGQAPIKVPSPPLPEWAPGAPLTVSAWVKPSALPPTQ